MSNKKYGTFIHGIAASEHLDSSGERIMIEGVDISSLTKDGVLNWEHKNENSSQIVGKILEAKKILKKEDCENEAHKYFWEKIKTPFIYIAGELFDHVGHTAAGDVAAMLRYDKMSDRKKTDALINFSIEGARLGTKEEKKNPIIKRCIARKVTITITPCNKAAWAEQMDKKPSKDMGGVNNAREILEKFKKSEEIEIELMAKSAQQYMTSLAGIKGVKQPKSSTRDYKGVKPTYGEQREGTSIQPKRTFTNQTAPNKMKVGDRIQYKDKKTKTGHSIYNDPNTWKSETKKKKFSYKSNLRKAITASCASGAPGSLSGGAALQRQELIKNMIEDSWSRFKFKDQIIEIIEKKSPDLTKSEVLDIAKAFSFNEEKMAESALHSILKKAEKNG